MDSFANSAAKEFIKQNLLKSRKDCDIIDTSLVFI